MTTPDFDLVIHGGQLVTERQVFSADLAIQGERIAAVGQDLRGAQELDASGLLVLPGAVDPHVHLETPVGPTCSSDDWASGTLAAACGGTTTVLDFVEPAPGESLQQALSARRALAEGRAWVDFGLHMTLPDASPSRLAEIPVLAERGCTSFKTYLTYTGFRLEDAELLRVLEAVRESGGLVLVHAESDAIIAHLKRAVTAEQRALPATHARVRPAIAEAEAVQRCLALAEVTRARVYLVHLSTALGVEALRAARGRGVAACGETCPQYLLLDQAELERPGFEGAKFVCSPPLRGEADRLRLWRALAEGDVQTVGTDHCPFNFQLQKELGRQDYELIPGGLPGIESRLALLYTFGVGSGRLSLERWVQVCSSAPARLFGLEGRKGCLEPGADADVVLFDPARRVTLGKARSHENVDYSPYEGFALQGYPVLTLLHGQVIVRDGQPGGAAGGRYLERQAAHGS